MTKVDLTLGENCNVLNFLKFHSTKINLAKRNTKLTYYIDPQTPEMLKSSLRLNMKLVEGNKTELWALTGTHSDKE